MDQRVASDFVGEPGAAITQDATFTIQVDRLADRDWLFEVAFLFDEPAFARTVGHGLVLQRTFATLVADRAVQRMVDEQQLEDAVLSFLHHVGFGLDDHAVANGQHA